jgi:hypothetical protein
MPAIARPPPAGPELAGGPGRRVAFKPAFDRLRALFAELR